MKEKGTHSTTNPKLTGLVESKESPSPKASELKASQKMWRRNKPTVMNVYPHLKDTYDKLVSLETKIELLDKFLNCCAPSEYPTYFVFELRLEREGYQSEYDQLIKQHNL